MASTAKESDKKKLSELDGAVPVVQKEEAFFTENKQELTWEK